MMQFMAPTEHTNLHFLQTCWRSYEDLCLCFLPSSFLENSRELYCSFGTSASPLLTLGGLTPSSNTGYNPPRLLSSSLSSHETHKQTHKHSPDFYNARVNSPEEIHSVKGTCKNAYKHVYTLSHSLVLRNVSDLSGWHLFSTFASVCSCPVGQLSLSCLLLRDVLPF